MGKLSIEERVMWLRRGGFNPIHLWGNVYLIRYHSPLVAAISFYTIKIFKE